MEEFNQKYLTGAITICESSKTHEILLPVAMSLEKRKENIQYYSKQEKEYVNTKTFIKFLYLAHSHRKVSGLQNNEYIFRANKDKNINNTILTKAVEHQTVQGKIISIFLKRKSNSKKSETDWPHELLMNIREKIDLK